MTVLIDALYVLCCGGLGVLSIFVIRQKKLDRLNRSFLFLALSILSWVGSLYFFDRAADPVALLMLGRINFAAAASMALCAFLFATAVERQPHAPAGIPTVGQVQSRYFIWFSAETFLLCAVTLATPWVDRSESIQIGQHVTTFGPFFLVYVIHLVAYGLAALRIAFHPLPNASAVGLAHPGTRASAQTRSHLRIVGIGILTTALVGIVCNILLPFWFHTFAFQEIGTLSTLGFVAAVGYAVFVHHLFDVRVIIRRTVVFTLLLGFITSVYGLLIFLVSLLVQTNANLSRSIFVANFVALVITGFSFAPLQRWLEEKTDRYLFHKAYDPQKVTREITRLLNDVVDLDEALQIVMTKLADTLKVAHAITYVFQPSERGEVAIKRIQQLGYTTSKNLTLSPSDGVIHYFQQNATIVATSVLQNSADEGSKTVLKRLRSLETEIAIPLQVGGQLAGLILLSGKQNGAAFNDEDRQLLEAVGGDTVSAIQKAKLYDSDQLKSEFVSIASHELLTPISAIQGYLSMILEHPEKIDAKTRNYLTKVFASAQRLSQLVKDLLSVSRIESGKIEIKPRMLDLAPLIADAVEQLQVKAKEKNLKLIFVPVNSPLPAVWADSDRVVQVLVNLIGNAIKYTPSGSVKVTAVAVTQSGQPLVKIAVMDTGLGISPEAREHLFEKFYRVTSSETASITGTGLGLYITKTIVEKMGGAIMIESVPGKGSTFSFTLPQFQVEHAAIVTS